MKTVWQKLSQWFDRYATVLKLLFVVSVLIFVVREIGRILREVNGQQIRQSLASQSPQSLVLMLVLGFVAVLPMLGYDFAITELLPGKFTKRYIVKSGWVVNTYTNIAGFGGLLGGSLRALFYAKEASKKQILTAISKIALFLLSGLSVASAVSLVLIFGLHQGAVYGRYWVWLAAGALYFPVVFIMTRTTKGEFFADLTLPRQGRLLLSSTLEWAGCAGFFLVIGHLLGQSSMLAVYPMFVVASLFGVISMVPGGLGSFDVAMILGLQMVGVNASVAVVWLGLYRVFYYVLPFLVGTFILVHDMGHQLNERFNGLLKNAISRGAQLFLTGFMYFSGIMLLLFSVLPDVVLSNRLYLRLVPYMVIYLSQLANIVIGFLLIGLARGVSARVKRAFWPTVVVLVVSIANTLKAENFPVAVAIFLGIVLVSLWLSRHQFYRERLTFSWGGNLAIFVIFAGTFAVYSLSGLYMAKILHPHFRLAQHLLFPSARIWFAGFLGVFLSGLVLILVFRYLGAKKPPFLTAPFDADRIWAVIRQFGGNEISHLAFLRDKQVYFYQEDGTDKGFFLFRQKANKLIVMGEPVGETASFSKAINAFMTDADRYGFSLVFYQVDETLTTQLHNMGFDFIMAGEEGLVDLSDFTLAGKRHRGERALVNKFERENGTFEIIQPPFDQPTLDSLHKISDEWLGDQVEKGFSLGYFDAYYLNQAPIAVARNADGDIVAFANIMPTGNHDTTSIDLMRYGKDAPSGVMDVLFVNLFLESQKQGFSYFNLGMTPLSNVGDSRFSFFEERVAHLIYEYGNSLYAFQGLRAYKEKYVDKWVPKFIAYRKRTFVIFTMLQIFTIVNKRSGSAIRETPAFLPHRFKGRSKS